MTIGSESLSPISSREGTDEDLPLKSKVVLSADFSELHKDSCKFVQSVKVCLTATELVVLKRSSEKAVKFSQVRKHPLKTLQLSPHEMVPSAVVVEIPGTVLRYVYQLENGSDLKEWLAEVAKCRESVQSSRPESKTKSCEIPRLHKVNELLSVYGEETQRSYSSPSTPIPRFIDYTSTSNGDDLSSGVSTRSTTPEIRSLSQNDAAGCCTDGVLVEDSNRHSIAPAATLPFTSQSTVEQAQRSRLPPKMTRAGSVRSFRHRNVKEKNHDRRKGKQKLRASVSDFPSLEKDGSTFENLQQFVLSVSPPSSPPPSGDFHSRFRHIQIRKGRTKFSPRIAKGRSDSLPHSNLIQQCTDPKTNGSHSSTLPRRNYPTKDIRGEDVVRTAPSSPVPKPAKSPKLLKNLKILHRRWQSSGGNIKAHIIEALREPNSALSSPVADVSPWPCPLHALPPRALAEELTLMDAEMLRRIAPHELQDGAWMDNKTKHKLAPNVMAMVEAFNRVALLVPTEILQETTPQARAKVISVFIQVASKCYQLRNYNSLKAVLAGLQCTPIYRLKKTWKEVPSKRRKRFNQLCRLMSEEDNWQLYRKELGRRLAAETPCVPFLGLFLTQVVQQESYHKMRVEKDGSSQCTSSRRRSSSFGNCIINSCALEAEKREGRGSTLSSSAPASPVCSDEEEDCDGPVSVAGGNMTHRGGDAGFLEASQNSLFKQSSLATSESSLDSKCSLDDYLKHRKVAVNPHSTSCSTHTKPFKAPNGFYRPVPDLKLNLKADECSLSQTSDCADLAGVPNLSAIGAYNEGDENEAHSGNSDSGFPSASTSRKASVCASLTKSSSVSQDSLPQLNGCPSELENSSLKTSRSLESLLDSYEEDSLKCILNSTFAEISRFSASLQSIDSVFSNEDDDEDPSHADFELSECNSETSFQLQNSFDSGTCLPPLVAPRARRALYTELQENGHSEPLTSLSDINLTISENEQLSAVHPRWVRRSQSYCVDTPPKRHLWRKKRSDPIIVIQNTHADEHREEIVAPYEQLHRYQMVSLGCCSGAEARPQLRTLLSDSTHNSEAVNYKLSCEREPNTCNH